MKNHLITANYSSDAFRSISKLCSLGQLPNFKIDKKFKSICGFLGIDYYMPLSGENIYYVSTKEEAESIVSIADGLLKYRGDLSN